ncbi:META domain-containing protein [Kistimonas asteriae]|uniref:META domain-containing protein n=1 Tax=Kistimonas asteriae TaxID=517724 RepID=UPI001BA4D900
MKRKCLVMASLLLTACSTFQNAAMTETTTLYEHDWVLVTMNGQAPVDNSRVTLRLESPENGQGRIFGDASCNRYFGTYTLDQQSVEIGRLASTLMACPDPVMKQEQTFLSELEQVTRLEQDENTLVLVNESGDKSLTFEAESRLVSGRIISETGKLPEKAVVMVSIEDVSQQDVWSFTIGMNEMRLDQAEPSPISFVVPYAPSLVKDNHRYSLSVRVMEEGRLAYINASQIPLELDSGVNNPVIVDVEALE